MQRTRCIAFLLLGMMAVSRGAPKEAVSSTEHNRFGGTVGELVGATDGSIEEVMENCSFEADGRQVDRTHVDACIGAGLRLIGPVPGLGSLVGQTNDTLLVCDAAKQGSKVIGWGCTELWTIAWEMLAKGLSCVAICQSVEQKVCNAFAATIVDVVRTRLEWTMKTHAHSPLKEFVGNKIESLEKQFFAALQPTFTPGGLWKQIATLIESIGMWVRWYAWRENHFTWLMDTLHGGQIAQSAWGTAEQWEKLGANDAKTKHTVEVKIRRPPAYIFSEEYGMRWDITINLLRKLHKARGSPPNLLVVEIGVFAGHFSKYLLDALPFVNLIGVDPYIGRDGTFPGDFSETMDPDIALATAAETFKPYGLDRAVLMDTTSETAAERLPVGSVDAVFLDGCHLYECIEKDIRAWRPLLRKGALLAGHDFSPQWPGVVRAVHEHRGPGKEVFLGMDWMWWWYMD